MPVPKPPANTQKYIVRLHCNPEIYTGKGKDSKMCPAPGEVIELSLAAYEENAHMLEPWSEELEKLYIERMKDLP